MSIAVINETIRLMCEEVDKRETTSRDWRNLSDSELLYETAVCIFGSQMLYELALATVDRLREQGLLSLPVRKFNQREFANEVVRALSSPIEILDGKGKDRKVLPRFKNRLSTLLAATVAGIQENKFSLKEILRKASSAQEARADLVKHISGFGPKQASLFLRRIGYCSDFAVLDIHVIDYLQLARGFSFQSNKLGRLSVYEQVESKFREVAAEFGHSLGCVDLATWITMRVAKREAYV